MDYAIGFEIERFDTFEEFLKAHPNEEGYYVTRYSNKTYSDYDLKNYFFIFVIESTVIPKEILV